MSRRLNLNNGDFFPDPLPTLLFLCYTFVQMYEVIHGRAREKGELYGIGYCCH